jgi:hypothetical protein
MLGAGLPSEPGGGLEGNVSARRAATPEGAPGEADAEEVSPPTMPRCGGASWPVSGPPPLSAVALCLLPASRRPRPGGHCSNGMRAMDQAHADAPCIRERVDRAVKAGACTRAACEPNHRSGSRGRCQTLHPRPPTQRADHRTEPSVEPSFFTRQPARRRNEKLDSGRRSGGPR